MIRRLAVAVVGLLVAAGALGNTTRIAFTTTTYPSCVQVNGDTLIGLHNVSGGIHRSYDNGATWPDSIGYIGKAPGTPPSIYKANGYFFACRIDSALRRSTNGGVNWNTVLQLPHGGSTFGIAADTLGYLYLGLYSTTVNKPYVYKSTDSGATWASLDTLRNNHVHNVAWNAVAKKLYANPGDSVGVSGAFQVTDTGYVQVPLTTVKPTGILPLSDGAWLFPTDYGPDTLGTMGNSIMRLDADGTTWHDFQLPFNEHGEVLFAAQSPVTGTIYAGTVSTKGGAAVNCVDLWASADSGKSDSWASVFRDCTTDSAKGYGYPRIVNGNVYVAGRSYANDLLYGSTATPHMRFPDLSTVNVWDLHRLANQSGNFISGDTLKMGWYGRRLDRPILRLTGTSANKSIAYKQSFETWAWDVDNVRTVAGGTIDTINTFARTGTHALCFLQTIKDSTQYADQRCFYTVTAGNWIPPGTRVTASAYVYVPARSKARFWLSLVLTRDHASNQTFTSLTFGHEEHWTRYSVSGVADDSLAYVKIRWNNNSSQMAAGDTALVYVDDIMVELNGASTGEPAAYWGENTARTTSWATAIAGKKGTDDGTIVVDGLTFAFDSLATGNSIEIPLVGVRLDGIETFVPTVGGNNTVQYEIVERPNPPPVYARLRAMARR